MIETEIKTTPKTTSEIAHELGEQYPNMLIVGSLGRAAHMGSEFSEFRPSGVRRDIDAWRHGSREGAIQHDSVDVDLSFEKWIRPEANGTYLAFPHDETLAVEVPRAEEVFAAQNVEFNGVDIRVPHPDVVGAISTMQYIQRPKDKRSMEVYNSYLAALDHAKRMPNELIRPFDEFRAELARRPGYKMRGELRNAYHIMVPERYRKKLHISSRINGLGIR